MSKDIVVTITAVDRFTPELRRARYKLLTPIGRLIPPKGTLHRQQMELMVRLRQAGRAIAAAIPGGSEVLWREVGETWGRRLEWLGLAYLIVAVIVVVAMLVSGR